MREIGIMFTFIVTWQFSIILCCFYIQLRMWGPNNPFNVWLRWVFSPWRSPCGWWGPLSVEVQFLRGPEQLNRWLWRAQWSVGPGGILWGRRCVMGRKVHIGSPALHPQRPVCYPRSWPVETPPYGPPPVLSPGSPTPSGHVHPSTQWLPQVPLPPRWPPLSSPRLVVPLQRAFKSSAGDCHIVGERPLAFGVVRGIGSPTGKFYTTKDWVLPHFQTSHLDVQTGEESIFIWAYNLILFYLGTQSNACMFLIHSKSLYFVLFGILPGVVHHLGISHHESNNTHVPLPGMHLQLPYYGASG